MADAAYEHEDDHAEQRRLRGRRRTAAAQRALHPRPRHERLHRAGQPEAEHERPERLPEHRERLTETFTNQLQYRHVNPYRSSNVHPYKRADVRMGGCAGVWGLQCAQAPRGATHRARAGFGHDWRGGTVSCRKSGSARRAFLLCANAAIRPSAPAASRSRTHRDASLREA